MSQISESVIEVCQAAGMQFRKQGNELYAPCPFHSDGKRPNFRVNIEKNSWFCDVCGKGGGAVEFIALRENRDKTEVFKELSAKNNEPPETNPIVATYDYVDQFGKLQYQVCRLQPKSFRQRRSDGKGGWIWNMEGVSRILYRLPDILKPQNKYVWVVEGEKDVETIRAAGMAATTNVGGAGKWCDAYSQCLKGKDVILCPDNDKPGREHMTKVMESLEVHASSIRRIELPEAFKDISDYRASFNSTEDFTQAIIGLIDAAPVMLRGGTLPIRSMVEMETAYIEHVKQAQTRTLDLSRWLPSLRCIRSLVPGELVSIVGDTGTSKTYVLQHIAYLCRVPTLLFELELPESLTFERFISITRQKSGSEVFDAYRENKRFEHADCSHVYSCNKSKLSPDEIESLVLKSELKMGVRPTVVMVDYIQLVKGKGQSRYERISGIAEELKVVAKNTGTIIILASQVGRDRVSPEISLHDAKDSGSIENSSGVVIGIWRDESDQTLLNLRVLKNTKGSPSRIIPCNIDLRCMRITERSPISDEDVPTARTPYNESD